jgi:acyl transferase domain-containing protein
VGSQLIENRAFRAAIEFSDYVLSSLPTKPNWKIVDIVTGECAENAIQKPEISQTVCTAVQMGLVDLLASWSIRPSSVVGHSSGEIAAAYASGYLTAAEAITTAWFRGNTVTKNTKDGSMLAVGMGPGKAEEYLADFDGKIQIAAINSPESTTLSGDTTAVVRLAEILKAKGEFNRLLRTGGMAYHSHHMQPLGQDYCARLTEGLDHIRKVGLSDSSQRYPRVAWVSSVHPHKTLDPEKLDASYWQMNLASPVRFSEAVSRMVEPQGVDVMLEVGPHAALKGPVGQIVRSLGKSIPYVSALERNKDARRTTLTLAGTLFALGASIDLVAVNAVDELRGKEWVLVHGCTAIDLPPYRYRYGPIVYNESRVSKEYRLRSTLRHDLLGSKVVGNAKSRPQWRNILRLKDLPWLGDHRLLPRKSSCSCPSSKYD